MSNFINPAPLLFVTAIHAGLLVHDFNIDKVTKLALTSGTVAASTIAAMAVSQSFHTHVERASAPKVTPQYNSSLPKVNPPRDDDKRYIQSKKHIFVSGGNDRSLLWPSV